MFWRTDESKGLCFALTVQVRLGTSSAARSEFADKWIYRCLIENQTRALAHRRMFGAWCWMCSPLGFDQVIDDRRNCTQIHGSINFCHCNTSGPAFLGRLGPPVLGVANFIKLFLRTASIDDFCVFRIGERFRNRHEASFANILWC